MFLKRIRQRHAAFHILTHLTNYLTKPRIGRLLFKNVEPAQKCESRIDHRCKLAGEDHLVMHLDLCETFQEVIDLRKPLLLLEAHDCQSLAPQLGGCSGLGFPIHLAADRRTTLGLGCVGKSAHVQPFPFFPVRFSYYATPVTIRRSRSSGFEERCMASSLVMRFLRTKSASEESMVCIPCRVPVCILV